MGKGDKKTRLGKLTKGTFGKSRPHNIAKKTVAPPAAPQP
ncbi:30S ribosomal protein THX [Hymenobacter edaphi]|uniref:30S ribosomal protein THX n=1 Tax=Hymenobacter edaphi TaxID=2211146 RepID=A0A328BJR3_9BACT|nr:30S ribosomal protein THX [Hymenobacter edaphi]RAK66651.1 30S ribosomal protein THX [Hymenobacter edaphi]